MRLGTVSDRLSERFVKPLALDRLCALVEPAMREARHERRAGRRSPGCSEELQAYTATPTGVGLDVPAWLRRLEMEVHRVQAAHTTIAVLAESFFRVPRRPLSYDELQRQLPSGSGRRCRSDSRPDQATRRLALGFLFFGRSAFVSRCPWCKGHGGRRPRNLKREIKIMTRTFAGLVGTAVLALGTMVGTGTARACDPPCCEYRVVTCYETRCVPCTETVTCYDECGRPYCKDVTVYHKVQVAVKKVVKVYS